MRWKALLIIASRLLVFSRADIGGRAKASTKLIKFKYLATVKVGKKKREKVEEKLRVLKVTAIMRDDVTNSRVFFELHPRESTRKCFGVKVGTKPD